MTTRRFYNLAVHAARFQRRSLSTKSRAGAPFTLNPALRRISSVPLQQLTPSMNVYRPVGHSCGYACCGGCGPKEPAKDGRKKIAYIALGSNLGDRFAEIERACREMDKRGIRVLRTSSLWETEPMYVLDQDRFVNGACEVETDLEPMELLDALQDIENTMGRHKVIDKGPRNIDLDILLYEDRKVDNERLKIPHIGISEREFVLRPLAELIPYKPLYADRPWKLTQDYLNDLPGDSSLSPLTPIGGTLPPISSSKPTRKTHVMAIINVTPDSFSDGGKNTPANLTATASAAITAGATILDIGGQSTAPGAPQISAAEEIARVVPAITAIRALPHGRDVAISIDTYRAAVAAAAVAAGASIVNDVSAGLLDPAMLPTVARLGCAVCLMHMHGTPATMQRAEHCEYPDGVVAGVAGELTARVRAAEAAGVRRWRMILDPGLGFAKTARQNVQLLAGLRELREHRELAGLPWLVGASRKSFVGRATRMETPSQRIWGTAATVAAAVQGGADVVRVHDVQEMVQVTRMSEWIWRLADDERQEL